MSSRKRKSCNSYEHYATCMAKYEMVCRGDMAYHSNIKGLNQKTCFIVPKFCFSCEPKTQLDEM